MDAAALVEAARASFERARLATGGDDERGRLAGRPVLLRFAGPFFADEFRRALALEPADTAAPDDDERPSLVLHAWDAATSGVRLEWDWTDEPTLGPLGVVGRLTDGRYRVTFDVHGALLSVLDSATRTAYHYLPEPSQLPYWERTHPARLAWSAWARTEGLLTCHAAAVAHEGRGVLLVGAGGAGKSTTALVCLADGMQSAGDDYVLVEPGAPPMAHPLYTSTLLESGHAGRHGRLMPAIDRVEHDPAKGRSKVVMFATGGERPRIGAGFPLVALASLRVERGGQPEYRPVGGGTVLRALAPTSLAQLGMVDAEGLRRLGELCRQLPTFELRLGDDPAPVPDLVRSLIAQAAGAPTAVAG